MAERFLTHDEGPTELMPGFIDKRKQTPHLFGDYKFKFCSGKHDDGFGNDIPPSSTGGKRKIKRTKNKTQKKRHYKSKLNKTISRKK